MDLSLDHLLLVGSVVLLVAVLAAVVGSRFGLPSLLLFLGVGLVIPPVMGADFNNAGLAHALGFAALVFILAEGGLTTRWDDIKRSLGLASLLATIGVTTTIALVAVFAHFYFHMPWSLAVLLGAVMAPTDSAAVFAVLRNVPLPKRVRGALEAESGLNDAPVVLAVSVATSWTLGNLPEGGVWGVAGLVVVELLGGVLLGAIGGVVGAFLLRHLALPASGLYPLATVSFIVSVYGLGVVLHVSGFAAVYVSAIILGNAQLPHRRATASFAEGVGWISQIGLFVMLGMLAQPARLTPIAIVEGLLLGAFVTFVARPVSVAVCATWFRMPWREQLFVSWAGLRGAVPIIMATVPLAASAPGAEQLFDAVFTFVVVFTLLQAPTLPWVARKLGIITDEPVDVDVEVAPLDKIKADFMQVHVPEGSALHGVTIQELRLPRLTVVATIVRRGEPIVPAFYDRVHEGDDLLIVVPSSKRAELEERLSRVGRHGRLASWHHDDKA